MSAYAHITQAKNAARADARARRRAARALAEQTNQHLRWVSVSVRPTPLACSLRVTCSTATTPSTRPLAGGLFATQQRQADAQLATRA